MARNDDLDMLKKVSLFSELEKKELRSVGQLMTELEVDAGRELTTEGAPGREFMIITAGGAEVAKDGEVVGTLGAGDFFGELSLITGKPRNATVTATETSCLLVLNRREMMALLDTTPRIARKILVAAVSRLADTDEAAARPTD